MKKALLAIPTLLLAIPAMGQSQSLLPPITNLSVTQVGASGTTQDWYFVISSNGGSTYGIPFP